MRRAGATTICHPEIVLAEKDRHCGASLGEPELGPPERGLALFPGILEGFFGGWFTLKEGVQRRTSNPKHCGNLGVRAMEPTKFSNLPQGACIRGQGTRPPELTLKFHFFASEPFSGDVR